MNDNPIRRAVDTRLSGLAFTPQMQADTLRRARLCNQTPHMRRKLSYSLAFALLALLLAATAGAAAYFGVLRFHAEQESNAAYQQHILPIGERLTESSTAITVNDAVFDGSSLSFSLDIAHLPGAPEVYLYPRVTAMQAGQIIPTAVTGFQQVSEDESYCLSANLSGFGLYEGIFMPARGIGKAIALEFAKEGANVAFTDLAIDENGKATEAEIAALGVKAKGYASNAANFEETHAVIDQIIKDFGRIDILVNNAGITKDGLMMRMSEAQWDAVLTVNLKSAFNFIHAVVPVMARQKSGSIINMSSVVGVSGNAGQCNYSASKAGMIGLAKSIAKEMGPRGIRANAIAPGFIMTEMTDKLPDEVKEGWYKQIPLRRGGTPEDVAKVALFLASDLSSYVSGQVIHCCGAMNC